MTTEGYRRRVLFRSSPQFSISRRLSMAVSPEAAKSAVLIPRGFVLRPQSLNPASSWCCPEAAVISERPIWDAAPKLYGDDPLLRPTISGNLGNGDANAAARPSI